MHVGVQVEARWWTGYYEPGGAGFERLPHGRAGGRQRCRCRGRICMMFEGTLCIATRVSVRASGPGVWAGGESRRGTGLGGGRTRKG